MKEDNKNKYILTRATEAEKERATALAKASNLNRSDYIRLLLFTREAIEMLDLDFDDFLDVLKNLRVKEGLPPIRLTPAPPVEPELLAGISWVGNNINQIAKQVNTTAKNGQHVDVLAVMELLQAQHQILEDIKTTYTRGNN